MKLFISAIAAGALLTAAADWQELSFYAVHPLKTPITLDGRLTDAGWRDIPAHTAYYEYFKTNPKPSPLKTEFRMAYDEKGIYLGVTNHGDSSKIRKFIQAFDSPDLWTDDCAEIYFDPAGDGIGYRRFIVNAIGCTADMMRLDASVTLNEWSGIGWMAKTSVEADRWSIEAFFPWSDLGAQGHPGDVWGFLHARFAWPNGFIGAVSSPNGNYMNTTAFTRICFTDGKTPMDLKRIGAVLNPMTPAPWLLQIRDGILYNDGSGVKTEKADLFLKRAEKEWKKEAGKVRPLAEHGKNSADRKEFESLCAPPDLEGLPRFFQYQEKCGKLKKLYWKIRLQGEFN